MKNLVWFLAIVLLIVSCDNDGPKKVKVGDNEKVVSTFSNGAPQIVREFKESDSGIIAVFEKEYYEDGNLLKEGEISGNKRNGTWKTYYRNGNVWNESRFLDGLLEDTIKGYYPDGQLKYKGVYHNGQKTGVWLSFDEDGKLKENKVYMQPGEKRVDSLYMNQ